MRCPTRPGQCPSYLHSVAVSLPESSEAEFSGLSIIGGFPLRWFMSPGVKLARAGVIIPIWTDPTELPGPPHLFPAQLYRKMSKVLMFRPNDKEQRTVSNNLLSLHFKSFNLVCGLINYLSWSEGE